MKNIIIILFLPVLLLSQEVLIEPLPETINTNNAELNFIKINDSTAYFTVVSEKDGKLESNIYITSFMNGEWGAKKYTKYNSDIFNIANISFEDRGRTFFTICNTEMLGCKIVYLEQDKTQGFYEIPALSYLNSLNTQGTVSKHDAQSVMYFVSDRKGGFGGLDIWLSVIDNEGKFGVPINAGGNINSSSDEITPFYNKCDGMMYFSSNKSGGMGEFDIYKSSGKLNLWKQPINVKELNTSQDELYITFYDENNGYFSSNRNGAKFRSQEYCCNDIFSFKYQKNILDTIIKTSQIKNYLPLSLYFHNDQPEPRTMKKKTKKTYKEAYISYFLMKADYEKQNQNLNNFFVNILQKNFNDLNKVLDMLLVDLSYGKYIELQIRGYASPLHNSKYNQNLSQRRISSFMNYLIHFKDGCLKEYIYSKSLTVSELPFGETNASNKVSDDANNKKKSVYSIEAMLERKIEIVDVILKK